MSRRPRWRAVLWVVLLLDAFSMLVTGYTTPFSIILTVLIGWTVAYGTLYAVGSPNVRPTGRTLMAGLRHVGLPPGQRGPRGGTGDHGERRPRPALLRHPGGRAAAGRHGRRPGAAGPGLLLPRLAPADAARHHHAPQPAVAAPGPGAGSAPRVRGHRRRRQRAQADRHLGAGPRRRDARLRAHRRAARSTRCPTNEITDDLLRDTWHQVQALQSRRIAHRRLAGDAILVDRSGKVILTDLRGGEIAAGDLLLRMDIAQLLTTLGLRVGAERAVASAVGVLGPDAVADCLPHAPAHRADAAPRARRCGSWPGNARSANGRRCSRRPGRPSSPVRRRPNRTPRPSPRRARQEGRPRRSSAPRSGPSTRRWTRRARRICSPRSATRCC